MNHKVTLHLPQTSAHRQPGAAPAKRLFMLAVAAWTLAGTGCFRATGLERTPMAAEVLPETGGDKVVGLKAKGGAGDLYLGNDFIQVAIDSTPYGDPARTPIAGAHSGGSIIDAGYILLDASYTRVSIPGNAMNRLTPVVNQDPDLQMVFSTFQTVNTGSQSAIVMTGGIYDPLDKLGTGASAGAPLAQGVTVTHSLSVAQLDRFFTVTTIVSNNTGKTLPIVNIGDYLTQQGGGYAFNIPAQFDYRGNALAQATPPQWGVQIPAYTDFANPVATSVQAPMVGLMDTEPGADTVDSHCSLGILPADADQLLVASDPQDLLTVANSLRPSFPARLVVGSLPAAAGLAAGGSLTYNRRLYIIGGQSVANNIVGGLHISDLNVPTSYPGQANGLFNLMDTARYGDTSLRPVQDTGMVTFTLSGMSQRQGPLPTQVRIERNVGVTTPPAAASAGNWQLQRVEWFQPNENLVSQTALAPSTLQVLLPVGIYRMVLTDQDNIQTRTLFEDMNVVSDPSGILQPGPAGPIWIQKDQNFLVNPLDVLCPDVANDGTSPNMVGAIATNSYSQHFFQTREENGPDGSLQPLRMTFVRTDSPANPVVMRRMRTLATFFDTVTKEPQVAAGSIPGQYQFRGGNEMFGTGFARYTSTQFAWFANGGDYMAYGARGPLSPLQSLLFKAFDGQTDVNHTFNVPPVGLPPSWTSFDLPGPGQATTGGYLTSEKLASGMANGVQVVGHTEQDLQVDPIGVYNNFRSEYGSTLLSFSQIPASLSAMNRPALIPIGNDPYVVGGRTSTLAGFGTVTALFTPVADNAPLGGALDSGKWNLADFLAQGQGQFNVVHRPRGPQGLFTLQGAPAPNPPAWNASLAGWWNDWSQQSGPLAFGKVYGGFDALELLRGEGVDGTSAASVNAWFSEFLAVRSDWFALLNQQLPASFTKALGLSSARFSIDTPVGLARTYLKANPTEETDASGTVVLASVLSALQSGAAVASTGPFLDVSVGTAGPGQLLPGPVENLTLAINLWKTDWMPVDELRVIVNGNLVKTIDPATLAQSAADPRLYAGTVTLPMAQLTGGQDGWIVVEAGVPLATTGVYAAGTPWNTIMRGIYPIAVTNPIFVDVNGGGYKIPTPQP